MRGDLRCTGTRFSIRFVFCFLYDGTKNIEFMGIEENKAKRGKNSQNRSFVCEIDTGLFVTSIEPSLIISPQKGDKLAKKRSKIDKTQPKIG